MEVEAAEVLAVCIALAFRAGEIIRAVSASGELHTTMKGVNDPCTLADLTAQKLIVSTLARHFPGLVVIGEEEVEGDESTAATDIDPAATSALLGVSRRLRLDNTVVWVDPLDGTIAFVRGDLAGVTTIIGISVDGVPVYGIVAEPFSTPPVAFWGGEAVGCWRLVEGEPYPGTRHFVPAQLPRVIVTSGNHSRPQDIDFLQAMNEGEIVQAGGGARKMLMVLKGEVAACVYLRRGMSKWDTCGPEALIKAVGGWLTDIYGRSILYEQTAERSNEAGVICMQPIVVMDRGLLERIVKQFEENQRS